MKGKNTFIASETGSGKTLAYLLPALSRVLKDMTQEKKRFKIKKEND